MSARLMVICRLNGKVTGTGKGRAIGRFGESRGRERVCEAPNRECGDKDEPQEPAPGPHAVLFDMPDHAAR